MDNVILLRGMMTAERYRQLTAALGKLGWRMGIFINQESDGVVAGEWTFSLVEPKPHPGLTAQQSSLLDVLRAGNELNADDDSPMARDLAALVELGLVKRREDGTYTAGDDAKDVEITPTPEPPDASDPKPKEGTDPPSE